MLVSPSNNMNQPKVEPPTPSLWLSQSTGLGSLWNTATSHPICFTHGNVYMSVLLSQFFPPSPSPTMSITCSLCMTLLLLSAGALWDLLHLQMYFWFICGERGTPRPPISLLSCLSAFLLSVSPSLPAFSALRNLTHSICLIPFH